MKSQRPVVIANRIRLLRSQHSGTFLVVEGRDDRLTCEKFTSSDVCKIIVAENKEKVCQVVEILERDMMGGVLGLVDADFDRIPNEKARGPNIISPDGHDLESMMIRSNALDALIVEFGSAGKTAKFGPDVRQFILNTAYKIGCLRLFSERMGLALRFEGLQYSSFVDRDTLEINLERMARNVLNLTRNAGLSPEFILEGVREVEEVGHDPWEVSTGEDFLGVLSIGFRKALGTNNAGKVSADELRRCLRLAFGRAEIVESALWSSATDWERRNGEFRVFSQGN